MTTTLPRELSTDEWVALIGIAHHPQSWCEAAPTGKERREGDLDPKSDVLLRLRELGLIDYVAPRTVDDFATCTVTELGRKALEARRAQVSSGPTAPAKRSS